MVKLLHILWLVLVQPRKIGKHPNMMEKLLTGMKSTITNKQTNGMYCLHICMQDLKMDNNLYIPLTVSTAADEAVKCKMFHFSGK